MSDNTTNEDQTTTTTTTTVATTTGENPQQQQQSSSGEYNIDHDVETLNKMANLLGTKNLGLIKKEIEKSHRFWDNQPVPKICTYHHHHVSLTFFLCDHSFFSIFPRFKSKKQKANYLHLLTNL